MTEGTIITFYSYKGGVGRTFALANIGALLSLWGYRILCIDWDLEAPGLHLYFKPWLVKQNHRGLTELIQAHVNGKRSRWQDYVTKAQFPSAKEPLLLMSAGVQDKSYVQRMQSLNWAALYESHNLGDFLENLRGSWKESLDFVLIDSRTGITDIGGICTVQLPDLLVLLFTANDQSLNGSLAVLESIEQVRTSLPIDRAKLLTMPIVARFEGRVEYTLAQEWLATFGKVLSPIYTEWAHKDIAISELLNFTRIPYVPYWSFGEKLPVIEKGTEDPEDIGFSLETLTALLAQKLSYSDVLLRNRDAFVNAAKRGPLREQTDEQDKQIKKAIPAVHLFYSYSFHDKPLSEELETHLSVLKQQGLIEGWTDRQIPLGSSWKEGIDLRLEEADVILLLISSDYLAADYSYLEMKQAIQRYTIGKAIVIPIILRSVDWEGSPLNKLQALPSNGMPIASWKNRDEAWTEVARGIRSEIQIYQQTLNIREQILGPDHPDSAVSLNILGSFYEKQGKYKQAEIFYQRALTIREQMLGSDHPDTAASLNKLAGLYQKQGRYNEAIPLLQHALVIREQELGPTHPDTASTLNDLAGLYQKQGQYSEAIPLYQRSLTIREQELGPTHPDTAMSLNDLAALYMSQGKYNEALPLLQRALAIREQELGPTHPDTASSLNNLAALYLSQGKYNEALPLLQHALTIYEQELGPTHPDTASSLNNLAGLYQKQGKYNEALPLYERALAICEQELGPTHPDTASSLNNLAALYKAQSQYSEAILLYQRALAIREQELGPTHPDTASSLNNLAALYKTQGQYNEALPLLQRALAIREQELGPTHPDTASSLNNLAALYLSQNQYHKAVPLLQRALAIMEQELGPTHPNTGAIRKNYMNLLEKMKKTLHS